MTRWFGKGDVPLPPAVPVKVEVGGGATITINMTEPAAEGEELRRVRLERDHALARHKAARAEADELRRERDSALARGLDLQGARGRIAGLEESLRKEADHAKAAWRERDELRGERNQALGDLKAARLRANDLENALRQAGDRNATAEKAVADQGIERWFGKNPQTTAAGAHFQEVAAKLADERQHPWTWGCIELMGHSRRWGRYREVPFLDHRYLLVETPRADGSWQVSRYPHHAIYGVTEMSEVDVLRELFPAPAPDCDALGDDDLLEDGVPFDEVEEGA